MTLVEVVKKNKLIKGGEESKILDVIECGEKYVANFDQSVDDP